jgi:hypothetical protein
MDTMYRNFYRNFYLNTVGFIPTQPLNQHMYPGDFFQIQNGEIYVLGNIFRNKIVNPEEVKFGYSIKLNPAGWNFSDGITKPYSARGTGQSPVEGSFEFSKQIIAFSQKGSFIFKTKEPESIKILNWGEIQQQLIIKFTQTIYSFREVYMVTETVAPVSWTLAIAGAANAELELATDLENFGLADIFGTPSGKTIQSKNIEYYQQETHKKPVFFKAKKLIFQDEEVKPFMGKHIKNRLNPDKWLSDTFDYEFINDTQFTKTYNENAQTAALDMLAPKKLNPNTALLYFKWVDANLDDIEKLFLTYGC